MQQDGCSTTDEEGRAMKVERRKEQVLTQTVGDDLVIYDERTQSAHRLNRTAARVWELADGERTIDDLAVALSDETGIADGEDLVLATIAELDKAGLLTRTLASPGTPISRRQVLTIAATVLPIVTSLSVRNAEANCGTPNGFYCPAISISSPPPGSSFSAPATVVIAFTASEKDLTGTTIPPGQVLLTVDSSPYTPAQSGTNFTLTLTGVGPGNHSVQITAVSSQALTGGSTANASAIIKVF
jgi:Coenzyme PQQ synthesis protein D (PqqD)